MDAEESQVYTIVIIASVVVGIIIFYFIYSAITHHKKMLRIERRNATAEITALEKDRTRIAADLHDGLSPMLAAIKMRINSFDLTNTIDLRQLERTNRNIDEMADQLRAISFDLMPASLIQKGVLTALHELISSFDKNKTLTIKFSCPGQRLPLNDQQAIHTYRIIQEIIHNTIKHANASELLINIERQNATLIISTRDDGAGFDFIEKRRHGHGLGLSSLENRIMLLEGEFVVTSKYGQGTSYKIEVPLK